MIISRHTADKMIERGEVIASVWTPEGSTETPPATSIEDAISKGGTYTSYDGKRKYIVLRDIQTNRAKHHVEI